MERTDSTPARTAPSLRPSPELATVTVKLLPGDRLVRVLCGGEGMDLVLDPDAYEMLLDSGAEAGGWNPATELVARADRLVPCRTAAGLEAHIRCGDISSVIVRAHRGER